MIEIRPMTIDDVPLGLRLTQQAGWNQTESDWLRFINMEPTGCFVAELDGASVGTTTTCVLGQVAWIAMVLVDVNARGKGVGTQLLEHSLRYLKQRNVETVRLDATPAGQPIYARLGFKPEYELARFEGTSQIVQPTGYTLKAPRCTLITPEIFADIIEFDHCMTGTDRTKMLTRLFEEFPQDIRFIGHGGRPALSEVEGIDGFAAMRPGANAVQIGPCIATADAGPPLLCDALARCAGRAVFVDIPLCNTDAVKIAQLSELRIQRRFMRMYLGQKVRDNINALWASSGPEKG
jgi:GNAT superfamily N-acetyltransferase